MNLQKQKPRVTIEIFPATLEFRVENAGVEPLRIWARSNSWGWDTFRLLIGSMFGSQEHVSLVPKPQIWTRNGPGIVEIPPGGGYRAIFQPGDPDWLESPALETLRDAPLLVQGLLRIPPSPEAHRLDVFVGEVASSVILSESPHGWLFANP